MIQFENGGSWFEILEIDKSKTSISPLGKSVSLIISPLGSRTGKEYILDEPLRCFYGSVPSTLWWQNFKHCNFPLPLLLFTRCGFVALLSSCVHFRLFRLGPTA
ncbi:hypothetical protein CEXT_434211 [Caerostris extrusa]|uniref:Uncharacterized protein n=1 Tax=Caerostris extrusa TaxID=172846 RepID=A0AAV4Y340_CAEEX|nr:hypothetical protein CEXT_434211 [Caerostris extrusa]